MTRYIIQRVGLIFLTLFLILSLSFIIIKLVPTYPPLDPKMDPDSYQMYLNKYGYNKPILIQYLMWIKNVGLHWDWGFSHNFAKNKGVWDILLGRLPVTMRLNIISFVISIPLGLFFGILAALKKNKMTDQIIMFGVMLFISIPSFVIMSLLILYPAYGLHWFPIQYPAKDATFWQMSRGMVLPVLALSFGPIAGLTRMGRAELTEVLTSEFLLLARTKGLSKGQTVWRHAMRNSLVPLVPIIIGNLTGIIFGSIVIEQIYGIPGIGQILVISIGLFDYNLTLAALAFYTIIELFTILIIDLSYGIVDPRIRMGAKK